MTMSHGVTTYFGSYEKREEAFRESVLFLIPRRYAGPGLFWKDFRRISKQGLSEAFQQSISYITSNPRDCLAFGSGRQVLTAAIMCAGTTGEKERLSVDGLAHQFEIHDSLNQPIRTLSGGETVKLALAKSFAAASYSSMLSIASPFSWLSRENLSLFHALSRQCQQLGVPLKVLALEGEDSLETVGPEEVQFSRGDSCIDFNLVLKKVRIPLGTVLNSVSADPVHAGVDDVALDLQSPCLIMGQNGQGKSLVAKVLSRAITFRGRAEIDQENRHGYGRLLFQDVMSQTLLRSFDAVASSAVCRNGFVAEAVYDEIRLSFLRFSGLSETFLPDACAPVSSADRTLLEVKMMLVAVRLCASPGALILDEPDWGLTKKSSVALVTAIISVSHGMKIPVMLISHKPWWHTIAGSILKVERSSKISGAQHGRAFTIGLSRHLTPA
jgi:ABC-type branched-subunit amino acid transport system ATPase component